MTGDYVVRVEGVTEQRAHEISLTTARQVVAESVGEAQTTIEARISALENRAVPQLAQANQLDAFADPAFVRTYRRAQEGAAATERVSDYDMLAALLTERAQAPRDRSVTAGIDRAIETVDRVDDEALRGVTILEAVRLLGPMSGEIGMGLDVLDRAMAQLVDGPLPMGIDWIDHLDILDVLRMNTVVTLRKFDEIYADKLVGYIAPGIEEATAPKTIGGDFPDHGWGNLVVPHEGKPGYVRIGAVTEETLRTLLAQGGVARDLVEAIVAAAKSEFGFGQQDPAARTEFNRALRERPTLGRITEWWDQIPNHVQVTAVGRMLARANMIRLDAAGLLPPLD